MQHIRVTENRGTPFSFHHGMETDNRFDSPMSGHGGAAFACVFFLSFVLRFVFLKMIAQ